MRKVRFKYLSIFFIMLMVLCMVGCRQAQMNPAQFLQNADTFSAYSLFDDNINPKTTYSHLNLVDVNDDNTYMYESLTGDERYLFTNVPHLNENPILSYFRVSKNNDNASLLGVGIGEQTIVYKNEVLGIKKTYSLYEYLKDQGFEYNHDFPVKYSNDLGDNKIIWSNLKKDNVFINYAVSADGYLRLQAYEVGIIDDYVYDILSTYNEGFNVVIEANDHTLISTHDPVYSFGDYVGLKVAKSGQNKTMKLYINNVYIEDFEFNGYHFESGFYMFAEDVIVEIIT